MNTYRRGRNERGVKSFRGNGKPIRKSEGGINLWLQQEIQNFTPMYVLGGFKHFVRFYESTLNCNISVNTYSI